jgi:hypothetical protein
MCIQAQTAMPIGMYQIGACQRACRYPQHTLLLGTGLGGSSYRHDLNSGISGREPHMQNDSGTKGKLRGR